MILADGFFDVPAGKIAAVVTHLEMTAPAPLRGAALPDGLEFAHFTPDLETYRDVFRRIGAPWLWFGRLQLSDNDLADILADPGLPRWTLLQDGRPEALLELDFRDAGACELAYFGVTPALVGRGAGAFLMDQAITRAWSGNITRFHVHTCTLDSPGALHFYERSGFAAYKRQIEIADDPRSTGLYPAQSAPQIPFIGA